MNAPPSTPPSAPLSRPRLLGFGVGSVGTGVFSALPGLLLLYYLTDVLGVVAWLAGLVLVLPKFWDVVISPVIGAASDREAVRTGGRSRLMFAGALLLPVLFAAMFAAPTTDPAASALWVLLAFILATTAFSLFQVPYIALPAEISPRRDQRSRAMSWRVVCLTLGILAAGGLAPAVVESGGDGRTGHLIMGATIGAVLLLAMGGATLSTRWIPSRPGPEPLGLRAALRAARGNRAFLLLALTFFVQALGVAVMLAGAPYIAAYRLGDYALTSVMFVCLVGPSLIAVPVWAAAARRLGTVRCFLFASIGMAATAAVLFPVVNAKSVPLVLVVTGVVGIFYTALQLLPLSLLPETVRDDAERSGQAQPATFTGLWSSAETTAMALGPGVFSVVLTAVAFRASDAETAVTQPVGALAGMSAGFTLLPAVLFLLSLPFLLAFRRRVTPRPEAATEEENRHVT